MSEEKEGPESGKDGAAGAGVDQFSAAIALSGASREEADAFLREQRALASDHRRMVHLQMKELEEEGPLKLSHMRVRRFGDYAKMGFEISVGLLVMALVAGISLMVWNAAHSDGLIIESFSVPPGLAARGVTGQVIATQVLDKLTTMQAETNSGRPAKSYASNWGGDLKVEIPDTGMSVGELYRFLRGWLGNETHISGEVTASAMGLAVTARAGGDAGATFTGTEAELDKIVQQAAEHVYRSTQPYRYGIFLRNHDRRPEAITLFKAMAEKGPAMERSYGYTGWSNTDALNLPTAQRLRLLQRAVTLNPDNFIAISNLAVTYNQMGNAEERHNLNIKAVAANPGGSWLAQVDSDMGAYRDAADRLAALIEAGRVDGLNNPLGLMVLNQIGAHDLGNARQNLSDPNLTNGYGDQDTLFRANVKSALAVAEEDWTGVIAVVESVAPLRRKYPVLADRGSINLVPIIAYATARLGNVAAAERMIAATPGDCYNCVGARARIAQQAKAYDRADFWFARAAALAPSLPLAHAEWGKALLERGKPEGAIEKFKIANQKSPHFADPLEGWGEALMVKNQSHLALAKFAEAEKYAPNWGRLHLKWGQALAYSGNKTESAKHFARAAQLDLTPSEKGELARVRP